MKWSAFLLLIATLATGAWEKKLPVEKAKKVGLSKKVLIDDFSSDTPILRFRSKWDFITDQLMGGVSTGRMEFVQRDGRSCLHMTGNVSLKNNGGFIQTRAKLHSKGTHFDARGFEGIYLRAKGNGQLYAIHLRTKDTGFPWQFYQAPFQTDKTWQEVKIPFSGFKPFSLTKPLDIKSLETVAIVAINKEFKADIFIDEISFYKEKNMYKKLTPEEERVIVHKGTEPPFSGKYYNHFESGVYTCKRCGEALFESSSKFRSGCGWPSFDEQIKDAVKWQLDADGVRAEIICANCGAHLGHVFIGEGLTEKNTRHCVNSISLNFISSKENRSEQKAYFAGGCFWGVEYFFQNAKGVISTQVGYMGGHKPNPTYSEVFSGTTGHVETLEVVYDPFVTTFEELVKLFFEIHDPTQVNRQGPDVGEQYRSAIFYINNQQKETAAKISNVLKQKGYNVVTELVEADKFWEAEPYHQRYFQKKGEKPYCHLYKKKF